MGSYSRKHMIEFAKFAKSYQSSKNVEEAYEDYRKGLRLVGKKEVGILNKIRKASRVFLDGEVIKDRRFHIDNLKEPIGRQINSLVVSHWNRKSKVLMLKTE